MDSCRQVDLACSDTSTSAYTSVCPPCNVPALSDPHAALPQDFHARYYHPSNSRIWFYGDDPPEERLRLLNDYLQQFEAREVDSTVHKQPLFQVGIGMGGRDLEGTGQCSCLAGEV